MKMVKCILKFEYFYTVFLKNRIFISKIRISKVTDYAALIYDQKYSSEFSTLQNELFLIH